jgi:competence protein ComEC
MQGSHAALASPLPWIAAAALALAILAADAGVPGWLPAALAAAVAAALALRPRGCRRGARFACVAAAFAALGAARFAGNDEPIAAGPHGQPRLVRLEGEVVTALLAAPSPPADDAAGRGGAGVRFVLGSVHADFGAGFAPLPGRVVVVLPAATQSLHRGTRVALVGREVPPRAARNPGEIDGTRARRRAGIRAVVAARSAAAIEVRALPPAHRLAPRLDALRERCVATLHAHLAPRAAGLAAALLFGVRDGVEDELLRAAAASGTIHVLAISGMHIALLFTLLRGAAGLLLAPWRAELLATLVAIGYAQLAGADAPVARAALFAVLAGLGDVVGRRPARLDALAATFVALLLASPGDLFRPGFQLSFAAVAALLLLPRREPPRGTLPVRLAARLRAAFTVSLRAALATAPLCLAHFGTIAPLGPILTLLILPPFFAAFALALPLAAAGALGSLGPLGSLGFRLASLVALVAEPALELLAAAFATLAVLPFASIELPRPGMLAALALCVAVLALVLPWRASVAPRRARARRGAIVAAALLVAIAAEIHRGRPPPHPEIVLLDVGHGQAALLREPSGHVLLIDAGSRARAPYPERRVRDALDALAVRTIDLALVTHADADHLNALPALLRAGRIRALACGERFAAAPAGAALLALARRNGVGVEFLARGARRTLGELEVVVLAPPAGAPARSRNDDSLVLTVHTAHGAWCFPGDVEEGGIRALLDLEPELAADVLLLPHHAHDDPALPFLLRRIRAPLWLASCDRDASIRLAPVLAPRLGAEFFTTRDHGALRVTPGRDGFVVESYPFPSR